MPTVAEAISILEQVTDIAPATLRGVARQLIDDGVLPKSSGRRIGMIDTHHFAKLLYACFCAKSIKDATRVAEAYDALLLSGGGATDDATIIDVYGETAGACLSRLIDNYVTLYREADRTASGKLSICLTHPHVEFMNTHIVDAFNDGTHIAVYWTPGACDEERIARRPAIFAIIPMSTFEEIGRLWREAAGLGSGTG